MFGLTLSVADDAKFNIITANIMFYNADSIKQLYEQITSIASYRDYWNTQFCNVNAGIGDDNYHFSTLDVYAYVGEVYDNCLAFEFTFAKPANNYKRFTIYVDIDTLDAVIQVESDIEDYTVELYEHKIQLSASTSIRDLINKQMSQVAFPSAELRGPFVDDGEDDGGPDL